jgi:hypothetical protein
MPIDWRVAAVAGGAALVPSVLSGLAPMVRRLARRPAICSLTADVRRRRDGCSTAAEVRAREPVAVVNRRAADLLWPGQDAVGRRLRLDSDPGASLVVVGVSPDISKLGSQRPPAANGVRAASNPPRTRQVLIIRPAGDAAAVMTPVHEIVASFDRTPRGTAGSWESAPRSAPVDVRSRGW